MDKKKYWLKLYKDFLKSPQMKVIRKMENGAEYILFYVSLMLESIEEVGHLRFSESIPYNEKMLAEITDTDIDVARQALRIFEELNMVERLDDGTIFLPKMADMTGKECESAERVRKYRINKKEELKTLQCNDDVTRCNKNVTDKKLNCNSITRKQEDNITRRLEDNKTIKQDSYITTTTNNNIFDVIEENFGRTLSSFECEVVNGWLSLFTEDMLIYAVKLSVINNVKKIKYIEGILKNWKNEGYKTLNEVLKNEKEREEKPPEIDKEILDYNWLDKGVD